MKRWAWNIFCILSLLVFVGSVGIWVRSYFAVDEIQCWFKGADAPLHFGKLNWERGSVRIYRIESWKGYRLTLTSGWVYRQWRPIKPSGWPRLTGTRLLFYLAGFEIIHMSDGDSLNPNLYWGLVFPLWLFLPAIIPPLLWLRRWRKKGGRGFPVTVTSDMTKENLTTREASPSLETQRHGEPRTEKTI